MGFWFWKGVCFEQKENCLRFFIDESIHFYELNDRTASAVDAENFGPKVTLFWSEKKPKKLLKIKNL